MKNGLILTVAVAALAGCASTAPEVSTHKLVHPPVAQSDKVELKAGQQALPENEAIAKAGEMKPVLVMTDGVDGAKAAYITGKQALGKGELAKAEASFEQARKLDATLVDAYVGLGVVHSLSSRHDRAVVSFDQAVFLEPDNANWHSNLGMAYARNGQFELAQQSLAKAWSLDPDNSRIEAQLTRVTSVAKANGLATKVVEPANKTPAPVVAASPLQKVGERVFNLNLGGSAPAVAADQSGSTQADIAPLAMATAKTTSVTTNVVHVNQQGQRVDAPAMPAIKVAKKKVMSPKVVAPKAVSPKAVTKVAATAPMSKPAPIAKAVEVGKDAVISDTVITFDDNDAKQSMAAMRNEPVRKVAKKQVVAKAEPVKKAAPVVKVAMVKAPVAKAPMVKAAVKPVVKKPVVIRTVRGMVIVANNWNLTKKVSSHLATKGLRATKLAKPTKQLAPLTEIHYRVGYEADVAAVTKALPVRAYPVELGGLPAGVNIKVVVGNDMKRAKL